MTKKIEIIADSFGGPYTVEVDGKAIPDVESYDLWYEKGVHRFTMTLLTDNFQLRRRDNLETVLHDSIKKKISIV